MSETPQHPTPDAPEPVAEQAQPAPAPQPAPAAVPVARAPWRDRLPATLPALALLVAGTLFGAFLTLGIGAVVDDDDEHMRGPGVEQMRWEDGPMGGGGHLRGGPGFGR